MKNLLCACFMLLSVITTLNAQDTKPYIFIDCQMSCQLDYIKGQINFVHYMQDRQLAEIYVLATSQVNGAGGREVQLVFEGSDRFLNMQDTVRYMIEANETLSEQRNKLVKGIKRGLLQYIIHTDIVKDLQYSILATRSEEREIDVLDPWNYWVFNIGGYGWINGEASYNILDLTAEVSASRITDSNKFQFSSRYNHRENKYILSDGEEVLSYRKSYNFYLEYVKSINEHWSVGGTSDFGSSSFGNTDLSTSIRAALEYNIFPYKEAQTRRFSFFYAIGPEYYDYTNLTVYQKTNELTLRHGLTIDYQQTQKWGNIAIRFGLKQYFQNTELYNAYLNPRIEWQISKGLSINLGGFLSLVNDRINIAQDEISDEDILLQTKQLDTDFTYFSHFGLNYRFGSKYNNYVNPRF